MNHVLPRRPTRRAVVAGALWSAPAVLIATSASAGVTSLEVVPPTVSVLAVRANGAGGVWEGTGDKAPGFRFGLAHANGGTANLTVTKTDPVASFGTILTAYNGVAWSSAGPTYAAVHTWVPGGVTVGVTVKQHDSAVGHYTATITPVGAGGAATATFEIYREGAAFRVRV